MDIQTYLKNNILYLDGGMGTLLQERGLPIGVLPERWNVTHGEVVTDIHKAYFDAGSNVVATNTFGANSIKFSEAELDEIICSAVKNAKTAREKSISDKPKWIALDIGPLGRLLKPFGELDFEEAVSIFASTVRLGVKYGVDLILIETMNDGYETKAALLAAKENSDLPVFVSNAYGEDGKLMTGATPEAVIAMLEGMGADAIGVNCSFGPEKLKPVIEKYKQYSSLPVLIKPNAGMPKIENGKTVYDLMPEEFSKEVSRMIGGNVSILGGCCGTTPEYIKKLTDKTAKLKAEPINKRDFSLVSSYTHAVELGKKPIIIGERINPTGKKRFKEALRNGEIDYILKEALSQQEKGADVLDVNVGLPEIDEVDMMQKVVFELQAVTDLPLQIDTSDMRAMEIALRRYNGKAMINSVNGKDESMEKVFPLVKKYGGVVVCLTLDEGGIPETAEGRLEIAKKILKTAKEYGIDKKDLVFDPLALAISADSTAGKETLLAVKLIKEKLGCNTSLGVSNVSFGLPMREVINSSFFTMALNNGLSAAIINPFSVDMLKAYYAYLALTGQDETCGKYVEFAGSIPQETVTSASQVEKKQVETGGKTPLETAIIKGLKEEAKTLTYALLATENPLDIINKEIIPALDEVGIGFEKKTVYLPQLLMSAEASKEAFGVIKSNMGKEKASDKCSFVIATVKGDIHDIGKNIVKLLLENYGFNVYDLGKDVPPEKIVETAIKIHAPIVGLSALMTTTVPAMEETIKLLREQAPWCKVVVGGAVLNEEYANMIGADKYAKDAMETVRYAESINEKL